MVMRLEADGGGGNTPPGTMCDPVAVTQKQNKKFDGLDGPFLCDVQIVGFYDLTYRVSLLALTPVLTQKCFHTQGEL